MAGDWNKMKDKMGSSAGGAQPADWEAMLGKINAQPALAPKSAGKAWLTWIMAASLGLVLGIGGWYLGSRSEANANQNEPDSPQNFNLNQESNFSGRTDNKGNSPKEQERVIIKEPSFQEQELENLNYSSEPISQAAASFKEETKPNQLNKKQTNNPAEFTNTTSATNTTAAAAAAPIVEGAVPEALKPDLEKPLEDPSAIIASETEEPNEKQLNDETKTEPEAKSKPDLATIDEINTSSSAPADENPGEESMNATDYIATNDSIPTNDSVATTVMIKAKDRVDKASLPDENNPPPFIDARTGFKLNAASAYLGFMHEIRSNSPWAYGAGMELQWQRKRQYFSAGLAYYEMRQPYELVSNQLISTIDSSWNQQIRDRELIEVSRIWVIDSFQAGRYVYDTNVRIVSDTNYVLQVDTNQIGSRIVSNLERPYSFVELPLVYGYNFGNGPWQFRLAGGVALQQALAYSDNESRSKSLFGISALLQPQLDWHINEQWSIFNRVQIRYPIQQEFVLYEQVKLRYSFQMGVSYRW